MSYNQVWSDETDDDGNAWQQTNTHSLPLNAKGRGFLCCKCQRPFDESEVTWYDGKPYGIPCGDYKDIRTLRLKKYKKRYESYMEEDRRNGPWQ